MATQADVEVVRNMYEAINKRDMSSLDQMFSDDVVFFVAGSNPEVSGERRSKKAVLDHLNLLAERSGGTWRLDLHDIVATNSGVVAPLTSRAERDGRTLTSEQIHVGQVKDGKIVELRSYLSEANALWS